MASMHSLLMIFMALIFLIHKCSSTGKELDITPSTSCNVEYRIEENTTESVLTITSNVNYECQVNARVPQGKTLLLSILHANIIHLDYLYVNTIEPSDQRFLTFIGTMGECQLVLHHEQVIFHLRSQNATVELQLTDEVINNTMSYPTVGMQDQCGWVGEYPRRVQCGVRRAIYHGINGTEAICSFTCPLKCVCTLSDSKVKYTCENGETGGYFIVFPPELSLEFLDFSQNAITDITPDAFQRLRFITVLTMRHGMLSQLRHGSLEGMTHLVSLDLSYNNIQTIAPEVFKDMLRLQILNLQNNYITTLGEFTFQGLFQLRVLFFRKNNLQYISEGAFRDLNLVLLLDLGHNQLETLPPALFHNKPHLRYLYLRYNALVELQPDAFLGLGNLAELHLHNNSLSTLESSMFDGVTRLSRLFVDANRLSNISPDIWFKLTSLKSLNLSRNALHDLRGHRFGNLSYLVSLDLQFNEIVKIETATFDDLDNMTTLYVDDISVCCYTTDALCVARKPAHHFMTCDWLLPNVLLKILMWLLGFSALLFNVIVIVRQCRTKKKSKIQLVQRLIIINLAASDLLMGIYLLIITSADANYQSFFPLNSEQWRSSVACKIASVLSVTSSEASIFFVTLISVERSLVVLFPFQQYRIGQRSFAFIILTMWTVALLFGIIPTLVADERFYEVSQICIGLPLVRQTLYKEDNITYDQDWKDTNQGVFSINTISGSTSWMHFSIAVFLGLNLICCIIIFLCYSTILITVRKTATHVSRFKESHTDEVQMALRMAIVVLTDFFCWMPIIIMGILVQAHAVTLSPTVYAWTATFLLPINSAVNPFLYTLATYREGQKSDWGTKELRHAKLSESGRDPVTQRELISMLPVPTQ